jgi:hypothetical protein
MSRGGSKITRNSFDFASGERVSWLDEFAENINKASKTAVEVARYRNELSLQDQINSVVSRQPTHATVEDVVQEYHERTGLADYLKAKAEEPPKADKVAFSLGEYGELLKDFPKRDAVMSFAKNKVETSYGQTSIPHIQNEIITQFGSEGLQPEDVENEQMEQFISDLITAAQKETPAADLGSVDLGKGVGLDLDDVDEDNNDFYKPLMPNTD